LGSQVVGLFMAAKHLEWGEYNRQVSEWELAAYLQSY
jgi:glutamine synthetase